MGPGARSKFGAPMFEPEVFLRCSQKRRPSILDLITEKLSMSTFILPGPGMTYLLYPLS